MPTIPDKEFHNCADHVFPDTKEDSDKITITMICSICGKVVGSPQVTKKEPPKK